MGVAAEVPAEPDVRKAVNLLVHAVLARDAVYLAGYHIIVKHDPPRKLHVCGRVYVAGEGFCVLAASEAEADMLITALQRNGGE